MAQPTVLDRGEGPAPAAGAGRRLGLALSGGGFRAAAFHLGVLRGLHSLGLLGRVEVVSAVSGGALLAAAWVARGRDDFPAFSERMRSFLSGDLKRRVLLAALRPDRLARLALDPAYSLTEILTEVVDRELLFGATLGSLRDARPRLVVNATCLNHGTGWRFTPRRMGDWRLATEDARTLGAFPLARAVAASAAFPGGFAPLVLRGRRYFAASHHAPREVLLSDGGIDDNLGVQALAAEECQDILVSDGSFPFADDPRPLDRFGLPAGRRAAVAALAVALASWGATRWEVPPIVLALAVLAAVLALLRLRLALWLFGSVMMRGQRRGLLRHLFGGGRRTVYLGLSTGLGREGELLLQRSGVDVAALRRIRTDLSLSRGEVDGLMALGEALALTRATKLGTMD